MLDDYTPYQQKIIKRFYANQDQNALQRLGELVTELFLAEGKKRAQLWKTAAGHMKTLGVAQPRIDHILNQNDPALVAQLVKELSRKSG